MLKLLVLCCLFYVIACSPLLAKKKPPSKFEVTRSRITYEHVKEARQKNPPKSGKMFQAQLPDDGISDNCMIGEQSLSGYIETGGQGVFFVGSKYGGKTSGMPVYDPTKSKTAQNLNSKVEGQSGDNHILADKYSDYFMAQFAGGAEFNQSFGVIYEIDGPFKNPTLGTYTSGIIGLGWLPEEVGSVPSANSSVIANILDNYDSQHYALEFDRAETIDGHIWLDVWSLLFGETGPDCRHADYFNLLDRSNKKFAPMAFNVDGFKLGSYEKRSSFTGRLDTGTTHIYVPQTVFDAISRTIDIEFDADLMLNMVSCDLRGKLGNLEFTIGGKKYTTSPFHYITDINAPSGLCVLFVAPSQFDVDFVFGISFLQDYCSVYSLEKNQVGLVLRKRN